jgi:HEAT repeat protein
MRQALLLPDWRDQDPEASVAAADQTVRLELARQFEKALREVLQRGDPVSRLAAMRLLADVAEGVRGNPGLTETLARLSPLVMDLIRESDPMLREAAVLALGQLDVPPSAEMTALGRLIESPKLPLRQAAAKLLHQRLKAWFADRQRADRIGKEAARAEIIHEARTVLPIVCSGLRDPDREVRRLSIEAFQMLAATVGKLAQPRLELAETPEEIEQRKSERERAELESLAQALRGEVTRLLPALNDPEPAHRLLVHRTLETLALTWERVQGRSAASTASNQVVGHTTKARDKRVATNGGSNCPHGPTRIGEDSPLIVSALILGVADPDVNVRRAAIETLEDIGPPAAAAAALVRALSDTDLVVRWAGARALAELGPSAGPDAVAALTSRLSDSDLDVRLAAAAALGRCGPGAREALSVLIDILHSGETEMRLAAIDVLQGIGVSARASVPALAEALAFPDVRVRLAAARVLGRLGPAALGASPALRAALADPDAGVRTTAGDALLQILPPPATPAIGATLVANQRASDESSHPRLSSLSPPANGSVRPISWQTTPRSPASSSDGSVSARVIPPPVLLLPPKVLHPRTQFAEER